jgi:hypothetical protein
VTPELAHQLVRMGLAVGVHVEHPRTLAELDELAERLSGPVLAVLDGQAPCQVINDDSFSPPPCPSVHVRYGQCALGRHRGNHGTYDGDREWHSWFPGSQDEESSHGR